MIKASPCKKCMGQGFTGKKLGPLMQYGFKSCKCPDCEGTGTIVIKDGVQVRVKK